MNKTTTKHLTLATIVSIFYFCIIGTPAIAQVQDRTLKFGHFSTADSTYGKAAYKFADLVKKNSDGHMKVTIYNSGQLGNESQEIGGLRGGIQDFFLVSSSPLTELGPKLQVLDFPGLLPNRKTAYTFLDGPVGQELLADLEDRDLVGLSYWENGFRQFTNSKRRIRSLDDFRGLKVRVIGNPIYVDMFAELGTNPVTMPFTELYTALETHTVDAQDNSMLTNHMSKFYEVQNYLTITKHIYNPMVLLVSKKIWDGMSDEEQDIINEAADKAKDYNRKISREAVSEYIKDAQDNGMTVDRFSEEQTREMVETMKSGITKYKNELDPDFVERVYSTVDEIANSN